MVHLLWKTFWHFLKKLNLRLSYDPTIRLLDIHPGILKVRTVTDIYIPMFITALFLIAKGDRIFRYGHLLRKRKHLGQENLSPLFLKLMIASIAAKTNVSKRHVLISLPKAVISTVRMCQKTYVVQ